MLKDSLQICFNYEDCCQINLVDVHTVIEELLEGLRHILYSTFI